MHLEQFRFAREIFNQDSVLVSHDAKLDKAEPALAFFERIGCPPELVHALLNDSGLWQYSKPNEAVHEMSVSKLNKYLKKELAPIYGLANSSLDAVFDFGFNRHDMEHIRHVSATTLKLVREVKYTKAERKSGKPTHDQKAGVMAAWYHDTGNILSRKLHSLVSARLAIQHNPSLKDDPIFWREVRRAIQLHNEPVATHLMASFEREYETENGHKPHELDMIAFMKERFGNAALALIIADKSDIGVHRISMKARDKSAVDFDKHLEVNLLGKTEEIGLNKKGDAMVWKIQFKPSEHTTKFGSHNELFLVESQSKRNGKKARVSQTTQDALRIHGFSHMDSWSSLFWSLYLDRILLAVRAGFALHPEIQHFKIKVKDEEGVETRRWEFDRDKLDAQFKLIRQKYNLHKDKKRTSEVTSVADQPVAENTAK